MTATRSTPDTRLSGLDGLEARQPGLRPPLPAWAPLLWFVVLGGVLSAIVVALVRPPGPLDQPDPAYQRDGLLLDSQVLPPEVAGVEFGDRPVVLLFDRTMPDPDALRRWLDAVPEPAVVRLVVPDPVPRLVASPRLEVVVDPTGQLAEAVDLPTPVDQGRGIGYAVVDSDRQVQYSTLDPSYLDNAFEITTIVRAVR